MGAGASAPGATDAHGDGGADADELDDPPLDSADLALDVDTMLQRGGVSRRRAGVVLTEEPPLDVTAQATQAVVHSSRRAEHEARSSPGRRRRRRAAGRDDDDADAEEHRRRRRRAHVATEVNLNIEALQDSDTPLEDAREVAQDEGLPVYPSDTLSVLLRLLRAHWIAKGEEDLQRMPAPSAPLAAASPAVSPSSSPLRKEQGERDRRKEVPLESDSVASGILGVRVPLRTCGRHRVRALQ